LIKKRFSLPDKARVMAAKVEDFTPGKRYVTPRGILLVALYLAFVTTMGPIVGLLVLWPVCESSNDTIRATNDLTITSVTPSSGSIEGGTQLNIRGAGFTDGIAVKLGQIEVDEDEVRIINSTLLRVISPAHEQGLVDVIVDYPNQASRILSAGYLYFDNKDPPPRPTIHSLSPTSGPLTGGQLVTIRGTGLQNVTAVNFGGLPGTKIYTRDDTSLTVATPPHAEGTVDVTVDAGTTSTLSNSYTYTCWSITSTDLFLMVIFAGTLGGSLHGIRSLVWHVERGNLRENWLPKYYLLPVSGAAIAVIFFLATSAGFYSLEGTGNLILIGLSALVGMFSAQAAEKLKSIAEGLLTPPKDSSAAAEILMSVDSIRPKVGNTGGNTEVTITGNGFSEDALVIFGTKPAARKVRKEWSQTLLVVMTPRHVAGVVDVFVVNQYGEVCTVRGGFEYIEDDLKQHADT
jgi:hypothetical protein